nr:zinc finger BED domain-containing protein RICESLEEPER 2 [Tanacetum cinerariifolium]
MVKKYSKYWGKVNEFNNYMYFAIILDLTMKQHLVSHGFKKMLEYNMSSESPLPDNALNGMVREMFKEVVKRMKFCFKHTKQEDSGSIEIDTKLTRVRVQVKTLKIQAGVQVSRPEDTYDIFSIGSALKDIYFIVFVLGRNIDGLFGIMRMEHRDDTSVVVFTSRAWGRLFDTRGTLVREPILEFLSTLRFEEVLLDLDAPGLYTMEELESSGFARDPVLKLCHRIMAHSIAGRSQAPEKSGAYISGGQFVARLAEHFGLLTAEILKRLTVIAPELSIIDMGELVRFHICEQLDDTWAWVAPEPWRQQVVAVGALEATKDAPVVDEGSQTNLAPVQAPQHPPPPPSAARTMP